MPALNPTTITDLETRLNHYLETHGGAEEITYLDAGGSAAVFKVKRAEETRAIKVFDPILFSGPGGDADRRRLAVQKRLIGHSIDSLIQTYRVAEHEGTAFIEMEFIEWPQLAKVLDKVPDEAIIPLIGQLVDAAIYLESLGIVHRDIKPENIHVTPNFKQLKLLDLGVAREFESAENIDTSVTDNTHRRPFLATAQYSSPEYLFRLDEPTSKLWRGLNIYQVGAVLHDLIKKEPLFQYEVSLGNRWLVARAVLIKHPTFSDTSPNRMSAAKALALRCLCKDIDTRLSLVRWEDFRLEEASDPISALKGRLSKKEIILVAHNAKTTFEKLNFDRASFLAKLFEKVRSEMINACGNKLPITTTPPAASETEKFTLNFTTKDNHVIQCVIILQWNSGISERITTIKAGAKITSEIAIYNIDPLSAKTIHTASMDEGEMETSTIISEEIASFLARALDHIEANQGSDKLPLEIELHYPEKQQ